MTTQLESLKKLREAYALLKVAKCPECDGSGSYGEPYLDGHGQEQVQQVQCQWCYEKNAAIDLDWTNCYDLPRSLIGESDVYLPQKQQTLS